MTKGRFIHAAVVAVAMMAAAAIPSCVTPDPIDRRIAADIAALDSEPVLPAYGDLEQLGSRAVPALARALQDKKTTPKMAFWIIAVLERTGDRTAVPALAQLADRFGDVEPPEDILSDCPRWDYLALRAREAIAVIVDPEDSKRFGQYVTSRAIPSEEARQTQKAYFTKVNAWYRQWRMNYSVQEWNKTP